MFDELLRPYRARIGVIPAEKLAEFNAADTDVRNRNRIQTDLLGGLNRGKLDSKTEGKRKKFAQRIKLVTAQKKFVQGAQELATDHKEVSYLLERARELAAVSPEEAARLGTAITELERSLAAVELKQRTLAAERQKATLLRARQSTQKLVMPAADAAFDNARDTPVVLALQQAKLLEMAVLAVPVQAALAPGVGTPQLQQPALATLKQQHDATAVALAVAKRIITAHGLALDCAALEGRLATQKLALAGAGAARNAQAAYAALNAEVRADFAALPAAVEVIADQARRQAQRLATARQRVVEETLHEAQRDQSLEDWLAGRLDAKTPPFVRSTLAKPLGPGRTIGQELGAMRVTAGSLGALRTALVERARLASELPEGEERTKKKAEALALADALQAMGGARMNELVQNYFLLTRSNNLKVAPSNQSDAVFLASTNSVKGDFNSAANLGKYTYHVTALANIRRKIDAGISVTGLSPSQGGLSGGSCDLALVTKRFHGTDIKNASIVNSQNKVASASNREGAMKVYIKQREDAVDTLMKTPEPEDAHRAKAAQETSVMLRFPLRAEYIGKFDKDPIHLTDNLALLDGTPIPPDDIEMLVHHKWMPITDDGFQDAYGRMMGLIVDPEDDADAGL